MERLTRKLKKGGYSANRHPAAQIDERLSQPAETRPTAFTPSFFFFIKISFLLFLSTCKFMTSKFKVYKRTAGQHCKHNPAGVLFIYARMSKSFCFSSFSKRPSSCSASRRRVLPSS